MVSQCYLFICASVSITSDAVRNYNLWSCQKVREALSFLSDTIYIDLALNYIDIL